MISPMSIKLSDKRYEEIKTIVANTFEKYDIRCVPISGFEIARKMRITCYPYSSIPKNKRHLLLKKSKDGFSLQTSDEKWRIYYNDEHGYGRINNTIMHEIGHIILDHSEDSELAEKEVKFFAKYALAPPILISRLNLKSPSKIASIFNISYEAAIYAYSYYKKWKKCNILPLRSYERKILYLFKSAL